MNGINKIVDLFKLSNDRTLIDPSENITNTKPRIKIVLLNFTESNWLLDFITKQLAIKPTAIMYNGIINLLYISCNTELTELSAHTNSLPKNPFLLLKNELRHSSNFIELVS